MTRSWFWPWVLGSGVCPAWLNALNGAAWAGTELMRGLRRVDTPWWLHALTALIVADFPATSR